MPKDTSMDWIRMYMQIWASSKDEEEMVERARKIFEEREKENDEDSEHRN